MQEILDNASKTAWKKMLNKIIENADYIRRVLVQQCPDEGYRDELLQCADIIDYYAQALAGNLENRS